MMPKKNQIILAVIIMCMPICELQDVKACKRIDTDFNECVARSMNAIRSRLKEGTLDVKLPSFDPMLVPKIEISQGSGPVIINSTLTKQQFYGLTNYYVTRANVDLINSMMTFDVRLPWLYVVGDYRIDGQILILPIVGSGDGWSNYTGVSATGVIKGHPVPMNGKEYFHLDGIKVDLQVEKGVIHMNNLFNGNKELGDAMNKFMIDNWELMFQELKPAVEEIVELLCKDIAIRVFKKYSLDDMFPK